MSARRETFALAAFLLLLPGCSCPWGSCRTPDRSADARVTSAGATSPEGTAGAPGEAPAAIMRNSTDAEIVVGEVEVTEGKGFRLKGTIVSAVPAAGRESIAEAGQSVTLTPYFPGGAPDTANTAHRRMMELSGLHPGAKIRCRIALDAGGSWRIVSAE